MEGVGALGLSSSPTFVGKINCSSRLSYTSNKLTLRTTSGLAAFHSRSHLFVKSPPCPQREIVARNSNKTGIFLPHLVASMVCFSISLFLNFFTKLIGTHLFIYLLLLTFSLRTKCWPKTVLCFGGQKEWHFPFWPFRLKLMIFFFILFKLLIFEWSYGTPFEIIIIIIIIGV